MIDVLGSGSFGTVYRGVVRGTDAAIKVLHEQEANPSLIKEFVQEVSSMQSVHHRNVIMCMGCCLSPLSIITELMSMSLEDIYFDKDPRNSLVFKLRLAREAVLGLNWLHSLEPMIIHRDVKPANFLVDSSMRVVVSDFGLSDSLRRGGSTWDRRGAFKGTILYSAPEILMNTEFDEFSDIYSFGLLLWTVLGGKHPFLDKKHLSHEQFVQQVGFEDVRPEIPETCPESLKDIITDCWKTNRKNRPNGLEVADRVQKVIDAASLRDARAHEFWNHHFPHKNCVSWKEFRVAIQTDKQDCEEGKKNEWTVPHQWDHFTEDDLKMMSMIQCFSATRQDAVVSFERFGKTLDWFGPWRHFVTNMRQACQSPWFFGDQSLRRVRVALAGKKPGCFLVRLVSSVRGGTFALNYVKEDGRIHERLLLRVVHKGDSRYYWDNESDEQPLPKGGVFRNQQLQTLTAQDLFEDSSLPYHDSLLASIEAVVNSSMVCSDSPFKQFQVALPEFHSALEFRE